MIGPGDRIELTPAGQRLLEKIGRADRVEITTAGREALAAAKAAQDREAPR